MTTTYLLIYDSQREALACIRLDDLGWGEGAVETTGVADSFVIFDTAYRELYRGLIDLPARPGDLKLASVCLVAGVDTVVIEGLKIAMMSTIDSARVTEVATCDVLRHRAEGRLPHAVLEGMRGMTKFLDSALQEGDVVVVKRDGHPPKTARVLALQCNGSQVSVKGNWYGCVTFWLDVGSVRRLEVGEWIYGDEWGFLRIFRINDWDSIIAKDAGGRKFLISGSFIVGKRS